MLEILVLGLIRCCLWKLISTKYGVLRFYYLHNLRRIRKYLSQDCLVTLIHAFVTSRLDYCNSLMYGLPQCQISKLQRVQNAAARIALDLCKFCHITPALRQLHWLPVVKRIQFKILLLTFKAIHGLSPPYISELITVKPKSTYGLCSNNSIYSAATSYTENAAYTWCWLLCCCCPCTLEQTACWY